MASEIRNDVMKTRAIVSDIHRVIVQNQEEAGNKHLLVSGGRTLAVTGCPLTAAQAQTRSAI